MTSRQTAKIREWVEAHREAIVQDIASLVEIQSISQPCDSPQAPFGGACREALARAEQMGRDAGFAVDASDPGCCQILWQSAGPDKPLLGLWGHLDVVPAGGGWHYPAYQLTQKDGFLIGRGVQDNKGPAVAAFYVLRCLRELGYHLPFNCAVCYGTSEENGMLDLRRWGKTHTLPDYNLVADCGFPICYGEMGNLRVAFSYTPETGEAPFEIFAGNAVNMLPDYASYTPENLMDVIEAMGICSHVAVPEAGENALANLAVKMQAYLSDLPERQQTLWAFIARMTKDGYGEAAGIACSDNLSGRLCGTMTWARSQNGRLELQADYRYPLFAGQQPADGKQIIAKLEALAAEYGLSCEVLRNDLPSYYPKEKPFVQSILQSYRAQVKSDTEPFVMSGGTYARMLPNAIAFGMASEKKQIYQEAGWSGGTGDYHQADESLRLEELLDGIVIYCTALLSLSFE